MVNEDVSMAVGHSTQRALVSMFNPHYYDNFFQEYLIELEKTYVIYSIISRKGVKFN